MSVVPGDGLGVAVRISGLPPLWESPVGTPVSVHVHETVVQRVVAGAEAYGLRSPCSVQLEK